VPAGIAAESHGDFANGEVQCRYVMPEMPRATESPRTFVYQILTRPLFAMAVSFACRLSPAPPSGCCVLRRRVAGSVI